MKSKYHDLIKHIPKLEDHGRLYMYYGMPYSHDCHVFGHDENENLIESHECHLLCTAIAKKFEDEFKWLDILEDKKIKLESIFDVDVETQDLTTIASLLLYLDESITYEDKFIDALNNGYLIRLLKRLKTLDESSQS